MEMIDTDSEELLYLTYSRQEILEDGNAIPTITKLIDAEDISFRTRRGNLKNIPLLAKADEHDLSPGTYTAIHTGYAESLIMRCAEDFKQKLKVQPTAKMLVFSSAISEAEKHYKLLKKDHRTSHLNISLATSDNPEALDNLQLFRRHPDSGIAVTVGMCAEGFDCPAITHLAILNTYRSAPYLEQAIGRVTRPDRSLSEDHKQVATVYAVNEPRNLALFELIRSETDAIIFDKASNGEKNSMGGGNTSDLVPVASRAGDVTSISLETGLPVSFDALKEAVKSTGLIGTDEQLAELANRLTKRSGGEIELIPISMRDQETALRRRIEARVREVAVKTGRTAHDLNSAIKKRYGQPRSDMTITQLSQVWSDLTDWCEENL